MGIINCEIILLNMVVGLGCHKKQHEIQLQLEEFNVLETLFNKATKNKEIRGPNGFERLLKYYVKLKPTQFIAMGHS
jgi:hypothetical protein